jgi:uncharacterized membrane protein (UPF0127 family)
MNKEIRNILLLLGGLLLVFVLIANMSVRNPLLDQAHIRLADGEILTIELARTSEEQIRGLSGREDLEENHGMLFVYEQNVVPSFWMRGMKFPIDIIWLHNGTIVGIVEQFEPKTFPETVSPEVGVTEVLEVSAGFAREKGLLLGDKLEIMIPVPEVSKVAEY